MSVPRIVVMELPSAERVKRWHLHWSQTLDVVRDVTLAPKPEDRIVWQLASGNNRAIARSLRVHATVDDALQEVLTIRARREELAIRSMRIVHPSAYAWVAVLEASSVVVSAREYSTVRDMRDSIAVAIAGLAVATLAKEARTGAQMAARR